MTHRKEILNLLVRPPCPECGAYEGKKFRAGSRRFNRFIDCNNSDCSARYGYKPLNGHNSGEPLRNGDLVIVEGTDPWPSGKNS